MRARAVATVLLGAIAIAGCGAPMPAPSLRSAAPPARSAEPAPLPSAAAGFAAALAELAAHDAASDWTDAACSTLAARFAGLFQPPTSPALHNAAIAEHRCGHDEAALLFAERAAAADPRSVASRLLVAHLTATLAVARGDHAAARRVLAAAIERDGLEPMLVADLAEVHVTQVIAARHPDPAALDLAAKACDQAIAAAPESARPYALRASLAVKERRFAAARADLDRALALAPDALPLWLHAGALAASLRDFVSAEKSYREALNLSPDDYEARLARALALRGRIDQAAAAEYEERYRAARDALASAIAAAPLRPEGHLQFAMLLLDHGWQRADGRGAEAAALAYQVLGSLLAWTKDTPETHAICERAREMRLVLADTLFSGFRRDPAQTERARKQAEAEAKQKEAEKEAAGD